MNRTLRSFALLAPTTIALATLALACPRKDATPSAAETHARLAQAVASWGSYRATLRSEVYPGPIIAAEMPDAGVAVEPVRVTTEIEVAPPMRMRMRARTSGGVGVMQFEGVWTPSESVSVTTFEGRADMPAQAFRVDGARTRAPERPFDLGFNPRGFGVFEGEDLRGSVRLLLDGWRYDTVTSGTFAGKPALVLRGAIIVDRVLADSLGPGGERIALLLADPPADAGVPIDDDVRRARASMVDGLVETMGNALRGMKTAELFVTPDGALLGWTLGGPRGLLQRVTLDALETGLTLPDARFTLDAAITQSARDVTEQVLQSRGGGSVDPVRLEAVRKRLRDAVAAP